MQLLFHSMLSNFLMTFSFPKFFENSSVFCSYINSNFFRGAFMQFFFWKLAKFLWHFSFWLFDLWQIAKTSTATNEHLTPLFWLASLSAKSKPIHQISLIYFQKAWSLQVFGSIWLKDQFLLTIFWFVKIVPLSFLINRFLYSSFA